MFFMLSAAHIKDNEKAKFHKEMDWFSPEKGLIDLLFDYYNDQYIYYGKRPVPFNIKKFKKLLDNAEEYITNYKKEYEYPNKGIVITTKQKIMVPKTVPLKVNPNLKVNIFYMKKYINERGTLSLVKPPHHGEKKEEMTIKSILDFSKLLGEDKICLFENTFFVCGKKDIDDLSSIIMNIFF